MEKFECQSRKDGKCRMSFNPSGECTKDCQRFNQCFSCINMMGCSRIRNYSECRNEGLQSCVFLSQEEVEQLLRSKYEKLHG